MHLLIVDAMNLIRRIYAAAADTELPLEATRSRCFSAIARNAEYAKATHVAMVFEQKCQTWRHDLWPDYKLGRPPMPEALQHDLADMQRMIDAYLEFARGQGREMPVRVDMVAMLERLAESSRREGKPVHVAGDPDISLILRPVAIERCFANLIGNAVKYAPEVWVAVERGAEAISIDIDDNGPGVPPELREDVFKPFFRGEQSRNVKTGGVGLGMPIAQDIIHAHGGEIFLCDSPKGGLRVSVILPV